jgi:acyl-CoA-binding protein
MGNFISKQISKPAARVGIAVFIAAYLYHMSTKKSKHDKRQFKTTSPTKNKSNKSPASAPTPHASTSTSTPTPTPTPTPPPAVPSTPVLSSEEIEANFEESQTRWPAFAHLATEDDKKQLYGLYKFILEGPPKPDKDPRDSKDLVKIWKWEAWTEVKCTTGDEAKIEYSNLVFSIGARGGLVQQDVNDEPGNNGPDDAAAMKVATSPSASSPSLSHKNTSLHLNSSTLVERFSNAEKYIKNQGSNLGINTNDLLEF